MRIPINPATLDRERHKIMTIEQAEELYKKAKGNTWICREPGSSDSGAIQAIKNAGDMVETMGGVLISRQTIAAIIVSAEFVFGLKEDLRSI